jgi:hypothetical protein
VLVAAVVLVVGAGAVAWTRSLRGSTAQADFAGQADQVCGDYHGAVGELGRPATLADVPAWVAREKPLALLLERQLRDLAPPAGERTEYGRFRALVHRQIVLLDAERDAARAGRPAAFHRAAAASRRGHAQERRLAERLQLLVCAR